MKVFMWVLFALTAVTLATITPVSGQSADAVEPSAKPSPAEVPPVTLATVTAAAAALGNEGPAGIVLNEACLSALLKEINRHESVTANRGGASPAFYTAWKKRWAACGGVLAPTTPDQMSTLQATMCEARAQSLPEAVGIAASKTCWLACLTNPVTYGNLACNMVCGKGIWYCNAPKNKWGKCTYAGV
jgi:hypothetical protein